MWIVASFLPGWHFSLGGHVNLFPFYLDLHVAMFIVSLMRSWRGKELLEAEIAHGRVAVLCNEKHKEEFRILYG